MSDIGVVVIGRNEGERLVACLDSILPAKEDGMIPQERHFPVVYVDSGSTDGSLAVARAHGADVVALDSRTAFSAARARNSGMARLQQISPTVEFVQFIDGDCLLAAGWIETGAEYLAEHPQYAVACGRRRERYPMKSIYNRLCDLEWNTPIGDAASCGGDFMVRAGAFLSAGGFNEGVVAGEEPELCLRLRTAGWKIRRLDSEMTLHDASMIRFGQWWKRSVRGGYGGMDVAVRFEKGVGTFSRQVRSARIWGIGWPVGVAVATVFGGWQWGAVGAALSGVAAGFLLPLQMLRVAWGVRNRCEPVTAAAYGVLTTISKWAHLAGHYRWRRDTKRNGSLTLMEYKKAEVVATFPGGAS